MKSNHIPGLVHVTSETSSIQNSLFINTYNNKGRHEGIFVGVITCNGSAVNNSINMMQGHCCRFRKKIIWQRFTYLFISLEITNVYCTLK